MEDKDYQKQNLQAIYSDASVAPVFKKNPKHSIGKFVDMTPYISYNDVMDKKFIIRGRSTDETNSFDAEEREVIVAYRTIDELINDGWRLD